MYHGENFFYNFAQGTNMDDGSMRRVRASRTRRCSLVASGIFSKNRFGVFEKFSSSLPSNPRRNNKGLYSELS